MDETSSSVCPSSPMPTSDDIDSWCTAMDSGSNIGSAIISAMVGSGEWGHDKRVDGTWNADDLQISSLAADATSIVHDVLHWLEDMPIPYSN